MRSSTMPATGKATRRAAAAPSGSATSRAWSRSAAMIATVPQTRVEPVTDVLHGEEIVDRYRWLEEDASPETRAWTEAQNRYTVGVLDRLPGRDALRDRLARLMQAGFVVSPAVRGERVFFVK